LDDFEEEEEEEGEDKEEDDDGEVKLLVDFPTEEPIFPVKVDAPATLLLSAEILLVRSRPLALLAP
jgi:hypothetical protein